MTIVLILALALAIVIAIWALGARRLAKLETDAAHAEVSKLKRQMEVEHAAYKNEAERLESLATGTGDERLHTTIAILHNLSTARQNPGRLADRTRPR